MLLDHSLEIQRFEEESRAYEDARSRLVSQLPALQEEMRQARRSGEESARQATSRANRARATATEAKVELAQVKDEHWVKRWYSGNDITRKIQSLEKSVEGLACTAHWADVEAAAAARRMKRSLRLLEVQYAEVERSIAMLRPPERLAQRKAGWLAMFVGIADAPPAKKASGTPASEALSGSTGSPAGDHSTAPANYRLPEVDPGPVPLTVTSIFELLGVRTNGDMVKAATHLGKEFQSVLLRLWHKKENGTLVDLTIGCLHVTLDKPIAEALWRKYRYFLEQTEDLCEIWPTSDFRDVLEQLALYRRSKTGGAPAADWAKSSHVLGVAIDQSARCQNLGSRTVPFDFAADGSVILVSMNGRNEGLASVIREPQTREAVIAKRRIEFADDMKRLKVAGGNVSAWESDQYEAALYELVGFPGGMGIYGAHIMSFEAGLKAGLVGAYCSVEQRPTASVGFRPDPIHSELSIHGSTAECGNKLGGVPQCYRVDRSGQPDCWRGSPRWNSQVEHQRRRFWGSRYGVLYGPARLDRYLPSTANAETKRR